jgi:bacterial/archaeal transporter family-2 protein
MDKGVAVVVAAVVGGIVVTQGPLNSQLGRSVGGLQASVVALGISFTAILLLATFTDGLGGLRKLDDAPLHTVIGGGLAGALYVGSIVWTVRALGVGGLTAVTIAGQLGLAVVIDHYGWLGVDRSPVTAAKVAGVLLLAVGTWLVIRD